MKKQLVTLVFLSYFFPTNAQIIKKFLGNFSLDQYGSNYINYQDNIFYVGYQDNIGTFNLYLFDKATESIKKITTFTNLSSNQIDNLTIVKDYLYFTYSARSLYRVNLKTLAYSAVGTFCSNCESYNTDKPKIAVLNDTIYVMAKNNNGEIRANYATNNAATLTTLTLPFSLYLLNDFVVFNKRIVTPAYIKDTARIASFNAQKSNFYSIKNGKANVPSSTIYHLVPIGDKLNVEFNLKGNADTSQVYQVDNQYNSKFLLKFKGQSNVTMSYEDGAYRVTYIYSYPTGDKTELVYNLKDASASTLTRKEVPHFSFRVVNRTVLSYSTDSSSVYFYNLDTKTLIKHTLNTFGNKVKPIGMQTGTLLGNKLYFNALAGYSSSTNYLFVSSGTPSTTNSITTKDDFSFFSQQNSLYSNSNYILANATSGYPEATAGLYVIYDQALGLNDQSFSAIDQVSAFPNPSKGTFSLNNLPNNVPIKVIDLEGKIRYEGNSVLFGQELEAGMYICSYTLGSSINYIKLIKQ